MRYLQQHTSRGSDIKIIESVGIPMYNTDSHQEKNKNLCVMIRDRCLFQENYASVKKGGSLSHKEVMKELSSAFSRGVNI